MACRAPQIDYFENVSDVCDVIFIIMVVDAFTSFGNNLFKEVLVTPIDQYTVGPTSWFF